MNFRNNSDYIQQQNNRLFRSYCNFVKVYVDNNIMYGKTLNIYINHLIKIFNSFER